MHALDVQSDMGRHSRHHPPVCVADVTPSPSEVPSLSPGVPGPAPSWVVCFVRQQRILFDSVKAVCDNPPLTSPFSSFHNAPFLMLPTWLSVLHLSQHCPPHNVCLMQPSSTIGYGHYTYCRLCLSDHEACFLIVPQATLQQENIPASMHMSHGCAATCLATPLVARWVFVRLHMPSIIHGSSGSCGALNAAILLLFHLRIATQRQVHHSPKPPLHRLQTLP